jgi:hypothetical protein
VTDTIHIVSPPWDAVNQLNEARLADDPVCGKCAGPLFAGRPLVAKALANRWRGDLTSDPAGTAAAFLVHPKFCT